MDMGNSGKRFAFYFGALALRHHFADHTEGNGEHEMDYNLFFGSLYIRMPVMHVISRIGEPGSLMGVIRGN